MKFVIKSLGEIETLLKTGKTPPSKIKRYYGGNINWYTPGDLDIEKYLGKSKRTITREAVNEGKATIFPSNSVLVGCIGDIGKLGIITEEASSNQQLTAIQTNDEVYYEYLFYYLKNNKHLLQRLSKNAIVPILNNSNLRRLKISYPKSLTDQKRIAQVLSTCENVIAKRKESIALLDELLKSTFLEMFGEREGQEVSLGNEIDIQTGLVNPNELPYSEMYHVGGKNIVSDTGELINLIKAKDENLISGKYFFEEGYLLYSKIRPNLNKVAVINFTGICSADVYPIKPKNLKRLNIHFLRYELMTQKFLTYAISNSGRANIPKINRKTLNAYELTLSSIDTQNKFAQIVEKVESIKQLYQSHLQELENLYGSLSQKAFKGELDVSKVEVEEEVKSSKETTNDLIDYVQKEGDKIISKKISKKDVLKHVTNQPKKRDITNLSLADFYGIPAEIQSRRENIEFDFIGDDLFYQFLLKDSFKNQTFTSDDLHKKLHDYFYHKGNMDYDHEAWKEIIFNFLDTKPPLLKQFFDESDNTIKLKLTDEAYKA